MIGRNDLCSCGSGKKYKKCCMNKEQLNITFQEIMQQFFNAHPTQKEIVDLYRWTNKKEEALAERYDNERLSTILGDAYFFTHRVDIWNEFIDKQMEAGYISAEAKGILSKWKNPLRVFGKITNIENGRATLANGVDEGTYNVNMSENFVVNQGDYVLAHFVPSAQNNTIIPLNSVLTLIPEYSHVENELKELASRFTSINQFWDEAMIEAFYIFGVKQKLEDREMSNNEQQVLYAVYEGMIEMEVKSDKLMAILIAYMHRHNVVEGLKKPGVLAAGVLQFGMTTELIESVWTKKKVAEFYDVSTSSAANYENKILEFAENEWVDADGDSEYQGIAFEVGTDARPSEYPNWQLLMHLKSHEIHSENEMKRLIDAYMNVDYKPKNKLEEAQIYAYEAYYAGFPELRENSTKLAHLLDPENADGLLLSAEMHDDESMYEKAVDQAKALFDDSVEVAWGLVTNRPYLRALYKYGMWCFEKGEYEKAFELMNQVLILNPGDHQGVRYPATASLIALNRFEEADRLMEHYRESDNAFFSWFRWAISRKQNFFGKETEEFYQTAMMDNGYVSKYIRDKAAILEFPKYVVITPDSPEEARVIWTLIAPLI
ncbi:SEC-C metal-binding domain-containing protein [Lederbergia panacisoli]|uniref:SEC-C metal-binding domain-containing protein n=1 Tax=Lederbergia panacisoli TaxID=1255251 RepID=UPI00214D02D7|nr:SEC-C metal-binding domain-containing protein [Lederbergia panacisoli]MCR2821855.1 SEC-C metal-binding domain-containing protein [Lederbergia panacisoli]